MNRLLIKLNDNQLNVAEDPTEIRNKRKFQLRDLKRFPLVFWIVALIAFLDSTAYFQFIGISTKLISQKYSKTYDQAKNIPLIVPLVEMILIPVLNKFSYHYGGKTLYLMVGSLIGIAAFSTIIYGASLGPYVGVIMVGLFYSFHASAFWSCVAIASEKAHVDVGLGIVNTMQNLSSFIFPILLGSRFNEITKSNSDQYLFILILMLSGGFILTSILVFIDQKTGKRLSAPEISRKGKLDPVDENIVI